MTIDITSVWPAHPIPYPFIIVTDELLVNMHGTLYRPETSRFQKPPRVINVFLAYPYRFVPCFW